jgi:homoserine O-succinyltransferase/O-acetyltransferase
MPVYLQSDRSSRDSRDSEDGRTWPRRKPLSEQSSPCITIGLINNMPPAAFTATERQFVSLLNSASEGIAIRLSLYSLAGIPRPEPGPESTGSIYSNIEDLLDTTLDGLIVTGKEPLTPDLRDEPCWKSFTQVLDWARTNTHSTVWSCLAAHAAVLYMDGIGRRRSEHKHFGLLQCTGVSSHQLTAGAPPHFTVPHSRWNGLPEEELEARGYSVLARTADAGVDRFVKQEGSLFVFFQGHPEYESDTLLREYRRDVGRYLRQEANTYPLLPRGYFDDVTESALTALRAEGMTRPTEELFAGVESALETAKIENTWSLLAARTYRNWLEYICARKSGSPGELHARGPISISR